MTRFADVDLTKLPAPAVVEEISFEAIFAAMVLDLTKRDPKFSALVESDPAMKILEVAAYREMLLRQRINQAARATMLAFARGNDLDNLAALLGVERAIVDEEKAAASDPEGFESDDRLRKRVQLSLEGFSTAGPDGAYIFHALSASPKVKDVAVASPTPGAVVVTVLSTEGDGTATARENVAPLVVKLKGDQVRLDGRAISDLVVKNAAGTVTHNNGVDYTFEVGSSTLYRLAGGAIAPGAELKVSYERAGVLDLVEIVLGDEDIRPLTDQVTVQSAAIITYAVEAELTLYDGPDASVVVSEARTTLEAYVADRHRIGDRVTESGIKAALHVPGVQKVALTTPAADVAPTATQAAYCTEITLTVAG